MEAKRIAKRQLEDKQKAKELVKNHGGTIDEHMEELARIRLAHARSELVNYGRNLELKEKSNSPQIESSRMGAARPRAQPSTPQPQSPYGPANIDRYQDSGSPAQPHRSDSGGSPAACLMPQNLAPGHAHSRQGSTSSQPSESSIEYTDSIKYPHSRPWQSKRGTRYFRKLTEKAPTKEDKDRRSGCELQISISSTVPFTFPGNLPFTVSNEFCYAVSDKLPCGVPHRFQSRISINFS
ncbi:hypothetical protein CFE70_007534 [Pyrenophora teres f. teres 0-1]